MTKEDKTKDFTKGIKMNSNNNRSGGVTLGFFDILALINIVLKLANVITWSWWIVLWPLWVELIIIVVFVIVITHILK